MRAESGAFRERWNPWCEQARALKKRSSDHLAAAHRHLGRHSRAAYIAVCGQARVGYSKTGEPLAGKPHVRDDGLVIPGVPTAQVQRCGARLCSSCARDGARRRRRQVMERLAALEERMGFLGPLRRKPSDEERVAWARAELEPAAQLGAAIVSAAQMQAEHEREARVLDDREDQAELLRWRAPAVVEPEAERPDRRIKQRRPSDVRFIDAVPMNPTDALDGSPAVFGVVAGAPSRKTAASFRVGLPPNRSAYGCRFITFTQPARAGEPLADALDRIEDALARLMRSQVWRAHVDAAVVRIEFELSTPERRKERAAEHDAAGNTEKARELRSRAFGTWWHVHAHAVVWGRAWPAVSSVHHNEEKAALAAWKAEPRRVRRERPPGCKCTRCAGTTDEDALLMCWRRALVDTKRYAAELSDIGIKQPALLRELRRQAHACRRTWAKALDGSAGLNAVTFGGTHIKTPSRKRGEKGLTPWAAVAEVVKYSCKPVSFATMPVERVAEVIEAIEGRRLIRCTGLLYGLNLDDGEDEGESVQAEGLETNRELGTHAYDADGDIVTHEDIVWREDEEALAFRFARLELIHDLHEGVFDAELGRNSDSS